MKRVIVTLIAIATVAMLGQAKKTTDSKPEITFTSQNHDFGTIRDNATVAVEYEFQNTGNAPLVIISVTNGGCGCTTPSFSTAPIKPGKKGKIKIQFNPRGRAGEFDREVKVKTNAPGSRKKLTFRGVIVPSTPSEPQ